MTREEAEVYARGMTYRDAVYNALQGKCIPYGKATLIKLYELLDRLEQEPYEDAISREDALMCLTGEIKETDTIKTIIGQFGRRIRKLPPVNAQLKTAYWIDIDDIESECSECGHREPNERFIFDDINYCAKCGAKMVEPQESEEV